MRPHRVDTSVGTTSPLCHYPILYNLQYCRSPRSIHPVKAPLALKELLLTRSYACYDSYLDSKTRRNTLLRAYTLFALFGGPHNALWAVSITVYTLSYMRLWGINRR